MRITFPILSIFAFFLVILHLNAGETQIAQIWLVFALIDLLIASTAHLYLQFAKEKTETRDHEDGELMSDSISNS